MAFVRINNTGINTDAIVHWDDNEAEDTLTVFMHATAPDRLGGATALRLHGEQRRALLGYLTHSSEDILVGDPWLGPRHTWDGVPLGVRRVPPGSEDAPRPSAWRTPLREPRPYRTFSSCLCVVCEAPAETACDAGHQGGECAAPLCWAHATAEGHPAAGVDIRCPAHRREDA